MSTSTDPIGFLEFTKAVAKNAAVSYFTPLLAVARWIAPLRVEFRLAALEFRANRGTLSFDECVIRFISRISGGPRPTTELGVSGESAILEIDIEAAIRTLRDTARFLEGKKRSLIDHAIAAERAANSRLRRQLFLELQVVEIERLSVKGRLARASYRESVRAPVQPEGAAHGESDLQPQTSSDAIALFEDIIKVMASNNLSSNNSEMRSQIESTLSLTLRRSH
jgi:hypothetical protein